mgnify:CR=1 FL=1
MNIVNFLRNSFIMIFQELKETPKINEEIDDAKLEEPLLNTAEVSSPKTNTPGPTSQSTGI